MERVILQPAKKVRISETKFRSFYKTLVFLKEKVGISIKFDLVCNPVPYLNIILKIGYKMKEKYFKLLGCIIGDKTLICESSTF